MLSIAAATATANSQQAVAPQPRLVHAAHEFEAQMMKELLKPMTGKDQWMGEDSDADADAGLDSGSGSGSALGEFASEALGQALSARGGFGVADHIIKALSPSGTHRGSSLVTADSHQNTVMKTSQ